MDKIYQIKILLYIIVETKIKLYYNHKQNEINAKIEKESKDKQPKEEPKKQEEELEYLRQIASNQEQQLKDVSAQASNLIAQQEQMTQNFIEQKNQYALALEQAKSMAQQAPKTELGDAIVELESDFNSIDENEAIEKLKNWIENA